MASGPAPARGRSTRVAVIAAFVIVLAALLGGLVDRSSASGGVASAVAADAPPARAPGEPGLADRLPRRDQGALGTADGAVPHGVTVFDDGYPAVAKLDVALRTALQRAATAAARDGVSLSVESGWRSTRYQEELLRQAISEHGSEAEAARWVATPQTSAHVSGDAVDIGPATAASWLSERGAAYGLCQVYRNEPWHYELRAEAVGRRCPPMYADPTRDPRMR